jgi:PKD repeat protein
MVDGIYDNQPRWSVDGTKIVFCSNRSGRNHIYSMNAYGTSLVQLTQGDYDDYTPDFYAGEKVSTPTLVFNLMCPADISVTDPDGLVIDKHWSQIPDAKYVEADLDGDGELDDMVVIPSPKFGDYHLGVTPEPYASPTDTFSLVISGQGTTLTLAQNVQLGEVPADSYIIRSADGEGMQAAPIPEANGPYLGSEGSPITFDASNSYDPDGRVVLYEWDFNADGVFEPISDSPFADYVWPDDFTGAVTLTVTDDSGLTATTETEVKVINISPVVDAGADQQAECGLQNLSFTGSFIDPGALDSHTLYWDFGDGSFAEGTLTPTHRYTRVGDYTVTLKVTDNNGGEGSDTLIVTVVDTTPPSVAILSHPSGWALQGGLTFTASANDAGSVIQSVTFSIRRDNGGQGDVIGPEFEDIAGTHDDTTGYWSLFFNTLALPDGYYIVVVKAADLQGNIGSLVVQYSIRNSAVVQLLPSSGLYNAGRTMPIKFSLRVATEVDSKQPFVYCEDLTIKIFATSKPSTILQTSTFGTGARNYRIDASFEKYITNFQTSRTPLQYTIAIYRGASLTGVFGFQTVK